MNIKKILIASILLILAVGAVSAADNITTDEHGDDAILQTKDNLALSSNSNSNSLKPAEKINASYQITVDEDYVENSGFESEFEIEMYEREYLNGKLDIYIDDELKYSCKPGIDYNSRFQDSWESDDYMNSYSIVDTNFLDRLGLTYGPHKAEFKYSGDTLFNDFDEVRYFNYTYMRFSVPEYETDYESELRFCVESNVATGNLKIVLDNKTIHDKKFTGYEYITLEDLTSGMHIYDIYYTGNGKFESIHRKDTFNINYEIDAFFSDERDGEIYINSASLKIFLPEDAKSNATVFVNNKTYSATVSDGQAKIALTNIKLGENVIYITYADEKYLEKTIVKNITATGLYFPYADGYCKYDKDAKVILVMPENANGTLKIKIDGEYFTSDLINGTASIPLDEVGAGIHNFEISYSGDFEEYFKNRTYENVEIYVDQVIEIDGRNVYVKLPEGETGTLIIEVEGDYRTDIHIENKTYYSEYLYLNEGLWNVKVTYSSFNIYESVVKTVDARPYIDLVCEDYYFKETPKIAYIDYEESSVLKYVTVYIDSKKYTGSLKYGEISLKKLSAGKHTIQVKYKNGKSTRSIKKKINIVSYSYPKIELKDKYSQELNDKNLYNSIALSDNTTLIMDMNLNGNINGKVTVYKTLAEFYNIDDIKDTIIGTYKSFNINKGKARISIPTEILNSTYSIKLEIKLNDGNVIDLSYMTHWTPKVVHPAKMTYGENKTLTIYVQGHENRTIGMFGNFNTIYAKIINGTAKFSLATLPIRNGVPVTFIYTSEEYGEEIGYYSSKICDYNLKLNIQDTFEKINMYYNDGTTYSLKVAEIYGKEVKKGQTVTFKIGSQSIKVKTDANGVAKLKIPNTIKPGTYTLTATYKTGKISKKLTVKQVLTLKAVKVKRSAKKLVLTATLKDKKVIKGKTVTFKFNGKTYKAKTNYKGIAKVTIKKSVLNKLKAGKKITYQATYLKNTVKKTVKVQK